MKSLRIKLAAIAVAIVALVAAPAAANAAYTPSPQGGTTTFTAAPGGSVSVPYTGFQPGETVRFSLTGENANGATLALVKTAVETKTFDKAASASGAVTVTVTLPSNATGAYTLSAQGLTSGTSAAAVTINAGQVPAATGVDSASLMGVWIGGGVLLLGGLAVTVFAVRRQRQDV
ncbi:hypothetical protein [Microbacterium sp. GXF7504]